MALRPDILNRIVSLGGSHGPPDLDLEPALRAFELPPVLVPRTKIEYPFSDFSDPNYRSQAQKVLGTPGTENEEIEKFVKEHIGFATVRTFDDHYLRPISDEWRDLVAPEAHIREVVKATELVFVEFAWLTGSPDLIYICLTDPEPADPTVYSTDHETTFGVDCIFDEGPLSKWLGDLMTMHDAVQLTLRVP